MGLSKTDYAKYQFMILVLRALFMLIVDKFLNNKTQEDSAWGMTKDLLKHTRYIENLMREE